MSSAIEVRSDIRKRVLDLRNSIPQEIQDAYSRLIRKKTINYLDSISAAFVHTYIGFQSEVATRGIIEDLFDRKIKVVVPVILAEKNSTRMVHSLLTNLQPLRSGKFDVPEPEEINEISIAALDAVIIPIVAFDGFGMRLGYGKGYYDRFLSTLPKEVKRLGLAFSIQEVDKIPKMSHDELINNIITEQSNFILD